MELSRRTLVTVAILLLVVSAGCVGGGQDGGDGSLRAENAGNGGNGGDVASEPSDSDGASYTVDDVDAAAVQERARIKTGRVELEVEDFDRARRDLTAAAEGYGGFVSDTNERRHRVDNETYTTGVVVLRVPRDDFSALMEDVRAQGTVIESNEETEDVTEQLVDIEARLDNLRAQRDRLRALYEDANDTEDVLDIEDRLTEVQTEIERLEAQKQSLERKVALSTIRVELREPEPDPEPVESERWYDTGALSAFLDSVHGVVVTARALAVATAYVLPYLIAFGGPIAIAGFGLRRRRRRRARPAEDVTEPDDGDE